MRVGLKSVVGCRRREHNGQLVEGPQGVVVVGHQQHNKVVADGRVSECKRSIRPESMAGMIHSYSSRHGKGKKAWQLACLVDL
jgi:hypothetical protein